jgi:hypothetical protein
MKQSLPEVTTTGDNNIEQKCFQTIDSVTVSQQFCEHYADVSKQFMEKCAQVEKYKNLVNGLETSIRTQKEINSIGDEDEEISKLISSYEKKLSLAYPQLETLMKEMKELQKKSIQNRRFLTSRKNILKEIEKKGNEFLKRSEEDFLNKNLISGLIKNNLTGFLQIYGYGNPDTEIMQIVQRSFKKVPNPIDFDLYVDGKKNSEERRFFFHIDENGKVLPYFSISPRFSKKQDGSIDYVQVYAFKFSLKSATELNCYDMYPFNCHPVSARVYEQNLVNGKKKYCIFFTKEELDILIPNLQKIIKVRNEMDKKLNTVQN